MPSHKHRDEIDIDDLMFFVTLPFRLGLMPFSALASAPVLAVCCLCIGCFTFPLGTLASVLLCPICLCIGLVGYIRAAILDRRDDKRAQLQHSSNRVICIPQIESSPPPVIYNTCQPYNPRDTMLHEHIHQQARLQPQPVLPYTQETPVDPDFSLV